MSFGEIEKRGVKLFVKIINFVQNRDVVMKTFSHLYEKITSIDNLFQAWDEFKKGKGKKRDVAVFERNLEDNLFKLHKKLASKTYKHSSYSDFFINDPKRRHIHKAGVKDRMVHHALYKVLVLVFEPTFINDSYSCRVGFGTHKAFKKLVIYSRKVSKNYTKTCWALKCDVKKFFDSVDHEILLELINKKVKDKDALWLTELIIKSYSHTHTHTHTNTRGIPLGNLTSQLFANIYLNELDQFVKHRLKVKYYLRYADDFILLHQQRKKLILWKEKISSFLTEELKLELHPNKIHLRKLDWGIDFVGYVSLPHCEVLRTKTKRRIFKKIKNKIQDYKDGKIDKIKLKQSIHSYLGILKHANCYKLEQDLKNMIFFLLN